MTEAPVTDKIRVMCADDHPLVRKGLAAILKNEADLELVGEAENGLEAVELFRRTKPDVALLDLKMPVLDGIGAAKQILAENPDARIIALTSFDGDQDIYRALEAGVRGYLLKESVHAEIVGAIRTVHSGRKLISQDAARRLSEFVPQQVLTPRETQVLQLVARGLGNKEIAAQLGTSVGTAKIHVQNLLAKLDATDRTHAVTIAIRRGIIHL